jgi:hypothetical protein
VKKILFLNQRRLPSMLDPEEDENVPGSWVLIFYSDQIKPPHFHTWASPWMWRSGSLKISSQISGREPITLIFTPTLMPLQKEYVYICHKKLGFVSLDSKHCELDVADSWLPELMKGIWCTNSWKPQIIQDIKCCILTCLTN